MVYSLNSVYPLIWSVNTPLLPDWFKFKPINSKISDIRNLRWNSTCIAVWARCKGHRSSAPINHREHSQVLYPFVQSHIAICCGKRSPGLALIYYSLQYRAIWQYGTIHDMNIAISGTGNNFNGLKIAFLHECFLSNWNLNFLSIDIIWVHS